MPSRKTVADREVAVEAAAGSICFENFIFIHAILIQ